MATDPFGLEMSGIPPELAAQYRGLTREQAIAEAMMKQGMAQGSGPINAGKFLVAPSPLEGVNKILQVLAGKYMQGKNDTKMAELGSQYQKTQAQQMADYLKSRDTPEKPAITLPEDQAGLVRDAMPMVSGGNAAAADIAGLSSTNPRVAAIAKILQAQTQKEADAARLEAGRNARHLTPSGSAILGQEGANSRHVMPTGSAILNEQGANQRFGGVSGSTQAVINARQPFQQAQIDWLRGQTQDKYGPPPATGPNPVAPPVAPRAVPQPGAVEPTAPLSSITNPAERAAYDQVAAAAAAGKTGTANATTGQFIPSPTGAAAPLVPGIGANNLPAASRPLPPMPPELENRPEAEKRQWRETTRAAMIAQERAVSTAAANKEARPPSATEQKAITDADNAVLSTTQAIDYTKQALGINDKAMGFPGAGTVANIGGLLPESVRPKMIDATQNLDNLIQTSVLPNLKSTFGGNPTEGERKILLEVSGSSSKPPAVRKEILGRAIAAAEARLKLNQQRAEQIRSRQYFTPSGNPTNSPAAPSGDLNYKGYRFPSQEALERFKAAGG
jgi:hypothetical protein